MNPLQRVVDVAAVVVLVTVVLSVLDDSLAPRSAYLLAGLVPVALLLGLALLLARREGGGWIFWFIAMLLYAPVGALVALRDPGPYLIPSLEAMASALGGTVAGPVELISTLPPVDASGEVLLVPYAIGYLAGGGAAWLALGTERSLAPVLPLLAGLATAIALGSLVPDGLVLRGAVFAALSVWWVSVRARRRQAAVSARRGATSQAVLGALVIAVVSALVVVLVPDDSEVDRVLLRGRFASEVDSDSVTEPILPDAALTDPELLLRVTGAPDGVPLRFAALDEYDATGWVAAGESPGAGAAGRFQRLGTEVTPLHNGPQVSVRVRVQPAYVSDWLPTLGELTSLDLDYTDGRTQLSEVRYNQATSTAFVLGGVDPRDDYTFTAIVTPPQLEPGAEPATATPEQRQPAGAFLDPYLAPWADRASEPMTALRGFMRHLARTGAVRLGGSATDVVPRELRQMLAPPRIVGTPHQYAAVVALAASRFGIPGRLVVGAAPGGDGRVLTDDVTSWVELQMADGTWREVDPERYLGRQRLDDVETPGGTGDPGSVGPGRPEAADDDFDLPKGADVDIPPGTELPPPERDDRWVLFWAAAGVLGLALLALLLVPVAKLVRRRSRRTRRPWSRRYVGGWQEVVDAARDRGTPVPDHLGRVPQARLLGRAVALARATDAAVFAWEAPSKDEEALFWVGVAEERRALVGSLPWHRRARVWCNPASLLASWRRARAHDSAGQPVPAPAGRSGRD